MAGNGAQLDVGRQKQMECARCMRWAAAAVAIVVLGACSSDGQQRSAGTSRAVPGDFALEVTVYSPPVPAARIEDLPRTTRPGRYVLEADGTLRSVHGPESDRWPFVPMTRQLTPMQREHVWRLARDAGLLDTDHPGRLESAGAAIIGRSQPTAIIETVGLGRRLVMAVALDRPDGSSLVAADDATTRLIDRLAQLAWQAP